MNKIWTCIWVDKEAEELSEFYQKVFANSSINGISHYPKATEKVSGKKAGTVMTVEMKIENLNLLILNGGSFYKFNPSFSFMVFCENEEEIKSKWNILSEKGEIRMGLDNYPWASLYGWTTDKFGVEWQLILVPSDQKICPAFLYVNDMYGKGEDAIKYYTSIFPHSRVGMMAKDEKNDTVQYAEFYLENQKFVLMEGPGDHPHRLNNSCSLIVNCRNQQEIDHYWEILSHSGKIEECGWLKDKFGLSWQITPADFIKLLKQGDDQEINKMFEVLLTMKKIELDKFAGLYKN